MTDRVLDEAIALADDPDVRGMLDDVCRLSGMGFAAVARVTEDRWIACQVLDRIEFGLEPGHELKVSTTICDDIRKTCTTVVIDDASGDPDWRTHPTPVLYGFKSYVSVPILLSDGSFFGTLCAIDPAPHALRGSQLVMIMEGYTLRIAAIVERKARALSGSVRT